MISSYIVCLLVMVALTAHPVSCRNLLKADHLDPQVSGTDVQTTQEYQKYAEAGDSMLQNDVQAQAFQGRTASKVFAVADSRKAAQVSSEMRNTMGQNDAQSAVQDAATGRTGSGAFLAAKEAAGIASVTMYGNGMRMDASNRMAIAQTDTQSSIQANLDDARTATANGAISAWAASYPYSHEWTNRKMLRN